MARKKAPDKNRSTSLAPTPRQGFSMFLLGRGDNRLNGVAHCSLFFTPQGPGQCVREGEV